ncbi:STAS domain-containing protein [Streptomyces sp. NPDC091219]|uniref:STAS domain-containing protein n=1 Tax=Streptomyces sp. NPDC091219 TaxID=3155193 RepID=UPI003450EEC5
MAVRGDQTLDPICIDGGRAVITPRGAVDRDTQPHLYAAVDSLPASLTTVTRDLCKVTFMDSAGLHLLEHQHRILHTRGGTLQLNGPQPQPLHLLHLAAHLYPAGPWLYLLLTTSVA